MKQETGETRDAILEESNRRIEDIVNANAHRTEPYWIVLFAKPSKQFVDGKPALVQHIKAYDSRPASQVGMICGKVDNSTGSIDWEVNMPQRPFDFDALQMVGGQTIAGGEVVTETTSIPHAYVTK